MKLFTLLSTILLLLISFPAIILAQSPTTAPSQNQIPEDGDELENIQKIKDIVASKVAELNLVEKRGIVGTVTSVNGMKIVVKDLKGNTRNIDADELTKFEFSDEDDIGISDLETGETYSFIGLYNKDTERLLARTIDSVDTIPVYFEGALKEINEDDFQLTLVNTKGDEITVDILTSTRTNLATEDGIERSGFSQLEVNSRILAIGFWDTDDDKLLSATRVIHFEDIPPSKETQAHITSSDLEEEN